MVGGVVVGDVGWYHIDNCEIGTWKKTTHTHVEMCIGTGVGQLIIDVRM